MTVVGIKATIATNKTLAAIITNERTKSACVTNIVVYRFLFNK